MACIFLAGCVVQLNGVLETEPLGLKGMSLERRSVMLIVTTIYWAHVDPVREPGTGRTREANVSDLKTANRKVVIVFQGSNHPLPNGSSS